MGYVADILSVKGTRVFTTTPEASVYEATSRMNQHKLGALLVVPRDQARCLLGIFTERDVLRRVVGQLRYPDLVQVGEVMTRDVITAHPDTPITEAAQIMQERRIRHLPIVNDHDDIHGIISLGDINAWHVMHQQAQIEHLNDYIYGRV